MPKGKICGYRYLSIIQHLAVVVVVVVLALGVYPGHSLRLLAPSLFGAEAAPAVILLPAGLVLAMIIFVDQYILSLAVFLCKKPAETDVRVRGTSRHSYSESTFLDWGFT